MSPHVEIEPDHGDSPTEVRGPHEAFMVGRRRVLGLAVAVGAVGVVAACGGGSDPSSSATTTAASTPPSSPATTGPVPLAKTADVPVGGGIVIDAQKVVVTQPTSGTFKAFTAICTHASCLVDSVANGVISCPCHGSQYSATNGAVLRTPATQPLAEIAVKVVGDSVVRA